MLDPTPIVALYRGASPATLDVGRAWYRATSARVLSYVVSASGFRLTRERAAAIVALLSPRKTWRDNIRQALRTAEALADGRDPGAGRGVFSRVRPLLRAACRADVDPATLFPVTAPKTSAFFRNLSGDLDPVTVDVWAARAAGVAPEALANVGVYADVADAYRRAAGIVGDAPASVQAVTWCAVRGAPGSLVFGATLPGMGYAPVGVY